MTFKEFWEDEEKKETDKEAVEKDKRALLEILYSKGFSEKQINEMRMDKAWKICSSVLMKTIERQTKAVERSISKVLKNGEAAFSSLAALWKDSEKRKLLVTDKGLRKDIFDLAASMDDMERGLFEVKKSLDNC